MKTTKNILCFLFAVLSCVIYNAQTIELKGEISASSDLDGIHVLNLTAQEFTITNDKGEFEVLARLNDTILISSIQYTPKNVIVSKTILASKFIAITLTDRVNELDEVVVGKVLTGNLLTDIENSDAKRDINFYDVGIPGYTGKPKTQKERRLYEADAGKSIVIAPLFVGINIHKILNKISGRTKKLKKAVMLEKQIDCMNKMKSEFSDLLFENMEIEEHLKIDFFYYVAEDQKFQELCQSDDSFTTYEFLLKKLYFYNGEEPLSED
ncbi:hypothetical protein [uncultured Psychroserpens sp.]|uniref:hypothetical protein n=1 Tax=uncultured Psychroserpens sp. TaxID=255436 RepID=UPI00260440AC|nr:hypothetical protein [uncultured Psychroserpens sp.]